MCVTLFATGVATLLVIGVAARAVNISNSWMLPEEGFPVFYRYFRDRTSWNEADAVCQFHHANLVTVDTTFQYDAIRAYLKELDIANNVWIGLSRAGDKPNFTWRDFHELSVPDYWQEAIPSGDESLCAAMDPATDFRWHALTCGGPDVASFICELSVPTWATGSDGCLITELPSLTVLYIPEQATIELKSDCGLDGTKCVLCKGKTDRDEMIRQLACTDESITLVEDKIQLSQPSNKLQQQSTTVQSPTGSASSTVPIVRISEQGYSPIKTTKPWIWTSNTIHNGDFSLPTRHRRETEDTLMPQSAKTTTEIPATTSSFQYELFGTAMSTSNIKRQNLWVPMESGSETSALPTIETSPEEFGSVNNQGQLYSIIMNGTMFDIIDLNDTEENITNSPELNVATDQTPCRNNHSTYHDKITDVVSTTTSIINVLSKKYVPELQISFELNQTLRKTVPGVAGIGYKSNIPTNIDNELRPHGWQDYAPITSAIESISTVAKVPVQDIIADTKEIGRESFRLMDINLNVEVSNATTSTLFATSKTDKKENKSSKSSKAFPQGTRSIELETTISPSTTVAKYFQRAISSRQRSETTLKGDTEYGSEPTAKPNRQRQLTHSNRRSFYPYFFSRVLG